MRTETDRFGCPMYLPDESDVTELKAGDLAPNCWGRLAKVARIAYRGVNVLGRTFIGYDVENGPNSTISHSMEAGDVVDAFYKGTSVQRYEDIQKLFGLRYMQLPVVDHKRAISDTVWAYAPAKV